MAITGLFTSRRMDELGIVTVLCHQSREEYRSDRGSPPRTAASRIITLSTFRGVPAVIHPNHFSRRLVSSYSASLSRRLSVFLILFVIFFSLLLEDGGGGDDELGVDGDDADDELSDFDDGDEDNGEVSWLYGDRAGDGVVGLLACENDEGANSGA